MRVWCACISCHHWHASARSYYGGRPHNMLLTQTKQISNALVSVLFPASPSSTWVGSTCRSLGHWVTGSLGHWVSVSRSVCVSEGGTHNTNSYELRLLVLGHAVERVVLAGQVSTQSSQCFHDDLLDLASLCSWYWRRQTEALDAASSADTSWLDVLLVELTALQLATHTGK